MSTPPLDQPTADQQAIAAAVGRPLNPDTNLPMPPPSVAQVALAETILAGLRDRVEPDGPLARAVRDALTEAIVRQHGRTLRALIAEARAAADAFDEDARNLAASAVSEGPTVDSSRLGSASRLAAGAATLRTLHLRGDRA